MNENEKMQEIDMDALEKVAGGGGKFKGIIQTIQMSEKEKREINSLLRKYNFCRVDAIVTAHRVC